MLCRRRAGTPSQYLKAQQLLATNNEAFKKFCQAFSSEYLKSERIINQNKIAAFLQDSLTDVPVLKFFASKSNATTAAEKINKQLIELTPRGINTDQGNISSLLDAKMTALRTKERYTCPSGSSLFAAIGIGAIAKFLLRRNWLTATMLAIGVVIIDTLLSWRCTERDISDKTRQKVTKEVDTINTIVLASITTSMPPEPDGKMHDVDLSPAKPVILNLQEFVNIYNSNYRNSVTLTLPLLKEQHAHNL